MRNRKILRILTIFLRPTRTDRGIDMQVRPASARKSKVPSRPRVQVILVAHRTAAAGCGIWNYHLARHESWITLGTSCESRGWWWTWRRFGDRLNLPDARSFTCTAQSAEASEPRDRYVGLRRMDEVWGMQSYWKVAFSAGFRIGNSPCCGARSRS